MAQKLPALERQLHIVFIAMAIGLVAVIALNLYAGAAAAQADDARNRSNLRLQTLAVVLSAMQDAETGQRGYLLTGEAPYLEPFEHALEVIDQRFARLHELYEGEAPSLGSIANMRQLADRRLALLRETIQVRDTQGADAATAIVRRGEGKEYMDRFRDVVGALVAAERAQYARLDALSARRRTYGALAYALVFASVLAVSVAAYFALTRQLKDKRRLTERLEHEASHDALTQLPNRRFFLDWIRHAVAQARREKGVVAVLFIDLDGFKPINDRFGHAVGDQVLELAAQRFRATSRESDFLARLGGDEFAVVTAVTDAESDAATLAQRLIASLDEPLLPFLHDHPVSASIGVAFFPGDAQDHVVLLAAADGAMYAAKQAGKRRYRLYRDLGPASAP